MADAPNNNNDGGDRASYGTALQKLLPSEVTAAYLTLRTNFINPTGEESLHTLELLCFFAIALAVLFYFILRYPPFAVASHLHRFFYCFCFLVWAANIEADRFTIVLAPSEAANNFPLIIGGLTVILSFGVPYFLRPVTPKK